jgi:hypothetical protein
MKGHRDPNRCPFFFCARFKETEDGKETSGIQEGRGGNRAAARCQYETRPWNAGRRDEAGWQGRTQAKSTLKPRKRQTQTPMNEDIVNNLLVRQSRMEEVRDGFEDCMQTAFDYVNPRRYDMQGTSVRGAKRKTKMYDGVAQDAFLDWVSGMLGWGVSENNLWQRAAIAEKDLRDSDAVQRFLDDATEQMYWEFNAGNFYDALPEQLQDGGSGGTAVMLTEESSDLGHCLHRVPHPGRYWIAENQDYEVDVYHEMVTMTARQAVQKYSERGDSLPQAVKTWADDPKSALWECRFLECICPADDPSVFGRKAVSADYALVTLLYDMSAGGGAAADSLKLTSADRLVRMQPLSYFSSTVWRFRRNSDELYGYSPTMDVMTMIEAAQQHAFNLANMGNRAANPTKFIPKEGTAWSFLPGATNTYGNEKRIAYTMEMAKEYPIAIDRENKIHELIRKRYGYQVWNMMPLFQAKRERTQATEIMEARADQARLLVGQMNNFWRSGIGPTYDNVWYIASRAGRMPEAPAELQERQGQDIIRPLFVGPLSELQIYANKLTGVQQGLRLLSEVAEIVGRHISAEMAAEIYDNVDLRKLSEHICDYSGFPQKLMRSDAEADARAAERARRALQQEQAATAQKVAAASAQLGKPVSPESLMATAGAM